MYRKSSIDLIVFVGLVILSLVTRLLPHPPNFAPMSAIALISGNYFSNRPIAIAIPIICMLLTDFVIGLHRLIPVTYLAYLLITILGIYIRSVTLWSVLLSSVIFFAVSNFGVWLLGGYGYTGQGLLTCYTMALPFFTNSVASDLFYCCIILVSLNIIHNSYYLRELLPNSWGWN